MDIVDNLLSQLTVAEKVSLLAGATRWETQAVPRLDIPALKMTDGPAGARGSHDRGGPSSASFPCGVALAATWNTKLVEQIGAALAEETQDKGAQLLLAPTVNIQRSPLAGRNFECYSEDPYLSGRMATAYIRGLQSKGVGACIKHFVCNDSEYERFTMSSEVPERALHEIYLTPFRMALRDAHPWAVMSAYNRLNGTYASENAHLLRYLLKERWGFDGIVISDWYGTYSEQVAGGGLDLEMPGPARWMGDPLRAQLSDGRLSEALLDDKVRRLLRTLARAGLLEEDTPAEKEERSVPRPEQRALIREAGREAIVLLKNQGALLPLNRDQIKTIAVIGENGVHAQVQGGGSIHVRPHYTVSPLAGIRAAVGPETTVTYEVGCLIHRFLPLCETDWLRDEEGRPGLTASTYDNPDLEGAPVHSERVEEMQFAWYGETDADVDLAAFSMRLRGTFTPPRSGQYTFGVTATGTVRLYVDGTLLITSGGSEAPGSDAAEEATGAVTLAGGEGVPIEITYSAAISSRWRNLRLGCFSPQPDDPLVAAERAAAAADVAIVVAGLTDEWESEGFDRPDMTLPRDQDELIRRVVAANANTIVVLNTGSPVTMPWLDQVPAVLQLWYAGQEAGNALADVLFGDADPGGRLPTSFPRRLADNPAYLNYPGENGRVLYGEGLFVGYRYYDKKEIAPLFPFGFGLSYTTFAYRRLHLDKETYQRGDTIEVQVEVENTGARRGSEVIQLYVRDVAARLSRPEKELKQFAKVTLDPGERRVVTLTLDEEALAFYDPATGDWVVEPGRFVLLAGHSTADIRLQQTFRWEEDHGATASPEGSSQAGALDTTTPLRLLLQDDAARRVLEQHLGELLQHPQASLAMEMTLAQIATIVPDLLPAPKLEAIAGDLAQLRGRE